MILELVSIINCVFFYSHLLLYRVSYAHCVESVNFVGGLFILILLAGRIMGSPFLS